MLLAPRVKTVINYAACTWEKAKVTFMGCWLQSLLAESDSFFIILILQNYPLENTIHEKNESVYFNIAYFDNIF
jgi:hypothetical protein